MLTLRSTETAMEWLVAGFSLQRTITPPALDAAWRATAVQAVIGEAHGLPPPGVIADIAALLLGSRNNPSANAAPDEDLEAVVARYEHQVLGRIASDPRLILAVDAIVRLPGDRLKFLGVGITIGAILARLGLESGLVSIAAGAARRLDTVDNSKAPDPIVILRDNSTVRNALLEGYAALCEAAQRQRHLLCDGDVFTLEHLASLENLAQRIALNDVIAAREAIVDGVPKRMRRKIRTRGNAATTSEEEDTYPVGGFSSMSTSGSIENLVTSELAYMEDGGPGEIDLFDVRFAQGELLYYTRDEATLLRNHRYIHVTVLPSVSKARVKDTHAPWQRIVMLLATLHALLVRVVDDLGAEDLRIRVSFPVDSTALVAEEALVRVCFLEQIERGVLEIVRGAARAELAAPNTHVTTGLCQAIIVGHPTASVLAELETLHRHVEVYRLDVEVSVAAWRDKLLHLIHEVV